MHTRSMFGMLAVLLLMTAVLAGCNIFSWSHDQEEPATERAEEAIRDGDYAEARKILEETDENDSLALYLRAKVAVFEAGIDMATIIDIVQGQDNKVRGAKPQIMETIDDLSYQEQTMWYQGNQEAVDYFDKIVYGETYGDLAKQDVALGHTVSTMMTAVLGLRDTNRDGFINSNDFKLDLSFIEQVSTPSGKDGFEINGGSFVDTNGQEQSFDGLEVFLGEWNTAKIAADAQGAQGYTPDMINDLLSFVLTLFDRGFDSVMVLLGDYVGTEIDAEEIEEYFNEFAGIANFYWYHDGLDNDGDGLVDEEVINGEDDDGDGLVDEDSGYHPADSTPEVNTGYHDIWQKWNTR